jgi:hypothetical protein
VSFLLLELSLGKIPDTHYPYLNYPNLDPGLNVAKEVDFDYPKLIWVIQIISPFEIERNLVEA